MNYCRIIQGLKKTAHCSITVLTCGLTNSLTQNGFRYIVKGITFLYQWRSSAGQGIKTLKVFGCVHVTTNL